MGYFSRMFSLPRHDGNFCNHNYDIPITKHVASEFDVKSCLGDQINKERGNFSSIRYFAGKEEKKD